MKNKIETLLDEARTRGDLAQIIAYDLNRKGVIHFDLTEHNIKLMQQIDFSDPKNFMRTLSRYIFDSLDNNDATLGIGRYNENRMIYAKSPLFNEGNHKDIRTIHLGIDLWTRPDVKISSPLDAKVHSFQYNNAFGDYGPTIILEHELEGEQVYTLYGHLTRDSLNGLSDGKKISAGEMFARIGAPPTNGNWPPHLHFQLITDLEGKKGDFPGVASLKNHEHYLKICLDPNLILGIENLHDGNVGNPSK